MKRTAFFLAALYFSSVSTLWSCPVCADLLERGRDAAAGFNLAQGLFLSILFMLSIPAVIAGTLCYYFKKKSKQHAGLKNL